MSETFVDLARWPRAAQFNLFRKYTRPHFAVTSRIDVSHLMARKAEGLSPYRCCLFAIGHGIHAVPELRMRFRADQVILYDQITLSMTVPTKAGSFGFAYLPFESSFSAFDAAAKAEIDRVSCGDPSPPNEGARTDLAYLSCMPWLDFTSISNAMPGPDDCIPRVGWGKFVDHGNGGWDMAMSIEVHHALADGEHVGGFFNAVQSALDTL